MPCNGIAVMRATLEQERLQADIEKILDMLAPFIVGKKTVKGTGTMELQVIMPQKDGSKMPIKMAIKKNGTLMAITQKGEYEVGVKILSAWLAQVGAQGVKVSAPKFEQHSHGPQAPQQTYNQGIRQ